MTKTNFLFFEKNFCTTLLLDNIILSKKIMLLQLIIDATSNAKITTRRNDLQSFI